MNSENSFCLLKDIMVLYVVINNNEVLGTVLGKQCESNLALGFDFRCHSYDETTCLGCTDLLQYSIIFDKADSLVHK